MEHKIKNIIKDFFIIILCIIIVIPMIIIGFLFMVIGRFISSLRLLFWMEPKLFLNEIQNIYKDLK